MKKPLWLVRWEVYESGFKHFKEEDVEARDPEHAIHVWRKKHRDVRLRNITHVHRISNPW